MCTVKRNSFCVKVCVCVYVYVCEGVCMCLSVVTPLKLLGMQTSNLG